MKIAFGMIIFEGDYVLKECLQQVYPFASQILIAEGPVRYWQKKGRTTSLDETNKILDEFPDPQHKIKIIHGLFEEKDDQCKSYMEYVDPETDYIWNLDSDEVYKSEDLEKIIEFLRVEKPTSVGIQSCSFYGGFDNYLTGFELKKDNFLRIFKYEKGATWLTHRPPTITYQSKVEKKHVDSDFMYQNLGVQMYHYSYVFPNQVHNKINYYKSDVSKNVCIDNYFNEIYLPWILESDDKKYEIEKKYKGVHEFKPEFRGECYTKKFEGSHPESIIKNISQLQNKFQYQLKQFI